MLKCDVKKFFDSIDQEILLDLLKDKIKDENTVYLISKIIQSYSALPGKGIPLGNITSQLFANVYLDVLDKFVKHNLKVRYYIRYCDDFLILGVNENILKNIIVLVGNFLQERLKLHLQPDKTILQRYGRGVDFLGYVCFSYFCILRSKTKNRMIRNIKNKMSYFNLGEITKESLNHTINSYLGVLRHCNSYKLGETVRSLLRENVF